MNNPVNKLKGQKAKKFLTFLPVITIPFLALLFWALGGGGVDGNTASASTTKGINNILPDAHLKDDKNLDKMSYYDLAGKDSARLNELSRNDPNSQLTGMLDTAQYGKQYQSANGIPSAGLNMTPYAGSGYNDPNEARIYQKLQQINQSLDQGNSQQLASQTEYGNGSSADAETLQRLEGMMQQMQNGNNGEDKETGQLDGMLEKILDIQNPERVKEKIRKASEQHRDRVFAVSAAQKREMFSELNNADTSTGDMGNGFYSLSEKPESNEQNAIDAVVHETQTLMNGSTVKLRLLDDVYINGKLIKKDNFIYGKASLSGERLDIKVTGIRLKKSLFPVELSVIDIDGMDGIYIPGAIVRDVAKESTDRAIQDVSFGSMSDNIGIQAASTGVEAAKTLFSKKVKLIKVTVKAGYKVLLRDEKQRMDNQ